ncbi:MAG: protein kinase [Planctomycetes bacterium]|nr:protein kinase [Planctomycetota bacterium]
MIQERPELRQEIEDLIATARPAAVLRPRATPQVPGYRLLRELGRGAMGIVYEAEQIGLERRVALKILPEPLSSSPTSRRRFLAEARSLARLQHEHVVRVFDVVETSEHCAYAMELIEGGSFAEALQRKASIAGTNLRSRDAIVEVCRVGIAIARALSALHAFGLLHRDVKPSNILMRPDGTALLSDFGLVSDGEHELTRSGQMLGTLSFAPPEQLRGDLRSLVPASDVYALGATLHQALAGTLPYSGSSAIELHASIEARRREPLTKRGVSHDLETILAKCLEPRIADRYQSAEALAEDLSCLLQLRPISARPLGLLRRSWRWAQRHRGTISIASAAALLSLGATMLLTWRLWGTASAQERGISEWRSAQRALLEPYHTERSARAAEGRGYSRKGVPPRISNALAHYDRALDWMPDRQDLRRERRVVQLAGEALRLMPEGELESDRISDLLSHRLPEDFASDPLLQGLHAFLLGDARRCHDAWNRLDLAPRIERPFLEAAMGQMMLAQDQPEKALPRLLRAYDAWSEEGFLALAIADCAVRIGDRPVASGFLEAARNSGCDDQAEHWIRGELLALDGKVEDAIRLFDQVIWHRDVVAQRHAQLVFVRSLHAVGRLEEALDHLLSLAEERARLASLADLLIVVAEDWWASLPRDSRILEIRRGWLAVENSSRLRRLSGYRELLRKEIRTASTRRSVHSSPRLERHTWPMSTLPLEIPMLSASDRNALSVLPPSVQNFFAGLCERAHAVFGPALPRSARPAIFGSVRTLAVLGSILAPFSENARAQVQWTDVTPAVGSPSGRSLSAASFDPITSRIVMYGGQQYSPHGATDETWAWDGATRSWSQLAVSVGIQGKYAPAMAEERGGSTILFSGQTWPSISYPAETWRWDGTNWQQLAPAQSPPGRLAHVLAYDRHRRVTVLYGGVNSTAMNDTWEWDGTSWNDVSVAQASRPAARFNSAMCYDPLRRRVVLFGGQNGGTHYADTWEWDGASWLRRNPTLSPSARRSHDLVWDEGRERAVLFGGHNGVLDLGDVWEWDGNEWSQRSLATASTPSARQSGIFVYDPIRGESLLFGGEHNGPGQPADTWVFAPLANGRIADTGPGCSGVFGTPAISRIAGSGPWIGSNVSFRINGIGTVNPLPLLLIGISDPQITPLLCRSNCTLRVVPDIFSLLSAPLGSTTWSTPIPNDATILGASAYLQVASLQLPSGCLDGLSNGLRITVGTR